jgi:hypothetical protein
MRALMNLICETDSTTDALRSIKYTALALRTLMRSPNPDRDKKTQLLTDLRDQIASAKRLTTRMKQADKDNLTAIVNDIVKSTGVTLPPPEAPEMPAPVPQRRATDRPDAPSAANTATEGQWRVVKLAHKTGAGGADSAFGIAENNGEFVVFHGVMGDKYSVGTPGSRDAAVARFTKAVTLGFTEVTMSKYPVIRGGTLPDLSAFGLRRDPFPVPQNGVKW